VWQNLLAFVSGAGYRKKGLQGSAPSYAQAAAATVTLDSALQLSSVWAACQLITNSVASLPLNVYKVDPTTGEKTVVRDHPLSILFNGKVNRWQTRQEFFETMTYQLVMLGNAYAAIQKDSKGKIIALVPLMSEQMTVTLEANGDLIYKYQDDNYKIYSQKSIWHNKLFGNGVIGLSPLAHARNAVGIGQAAESAVTNIYQNGGKPSGLLMIDKVISKDQRTRIKENFAELTYGSNANRLFVLEAGMKYEKVSLSPQDIELLASRRFQVEDIARFFGVPSVLINDMNAATAWGSGIEQIVLGWFKLGLQPYLKRYEASMKSWLLTIEEQQTMEIRFDFDGLLEASESDRVKAGKEAVQGGIKTPNEVRKRAGDPPLPGGDSLFMQQQMVPVNQLATLKRGGTTGSNPQDSNV
jgi:HK97 family phage portal protein